MTSLGVGLLGLINLETAWLTVVFVIAFGIGWGGVVPMIPGLLKDYFGQERLGAVVGFTGGVMMIGTMIGAPLAGWIFDNWGRYQPAWFGLAVELFLAALVFYLGMRGKSDHRTGEV